MASKQVPGALDVLQRLGRPGFPKGMVVLLVVGAGGERQEIEEQLGKLCYQVCSRETCAQARQELLTQGAACFDIILAEANLVVKDDNEGQLLLQASQGLPLVLISSPATTTECVWRGIEVGAADVLEKPLSLLKLQNIWQHVVRKVMDRQQSSPSRPGVLCSPEEEAVNQQVGGFSPSRCTLSSSLSGATVAQIQEDKAAADHESCISGSQDGKEASLDASISNTSPADSYTVDSSSGFSGITQLYPNNKPMKKAKRIREPPHAKDGAQPVPLCPYTSQPFASTTQSGSPTVVGMVHPSWASPPPGGQAFRCNIPSGCVWGTPLHPPPGWQGMFPNGSGPLLGSAANHSSISRCNSAPVHKVEALNARLPGSEALPGIDAALLGDFTEDLILDDDFLDCGDSFFSGLDGAAVLPTATEPVLEKPPIGLSLRKSDSFVNMINLQLSRCRAEGASVA